MKTILFDLDGTLLPLKFEPFFREYLKSISAYCACLTDPRFFVEALLKCTGIMMNNDGSSTNEELFMKYFLPELGLTREEVYPVLERFYSREFCRLKEFVEPSSLPSRIVEHALDTGWQIVLATNPVFPRLAIEERMRWVGIDHFPWRHVTSYETSRACKPNLLYYREIIGKLDLCPEECWMVGNDLNEDMAAGELGMRTYLVKDHLSGQGRGCRRPDREGSLQDLYELIRNSRL